MNNKKKLMWLTLLAWLHRQCPNEDVTTAGLQELNAQEEVLLQQQNDIVGGLGALQGLNLEEDTKELQGSMEDMPLWDQGKN